MEGEYKFICLGLSPSHSICKNMPGDGTSRVGNIDNGVWNLQEVRKMGSLDLTLEANAKTSYPVPCTSLL